MWTHNFSWLNLLYRTFGKLILQWNCTIGTTPNQTVQHHVHLQICYHVNKWLTVKTSNQKVRLFIYQTKVKNWIMYTFVFCVTCGRFVTSKDNMQHWKFTDCLTQNIWAWSYLSSSSKRHNILFIKQTSHVPNVRKETSIHSFENEKLKRPATSTSLTRSDSS